MHWYIDVLKKYATFNGRASRSEYWMFTLINTLIIIALSILGNVLVSAAPAAAGIFGILMIVYVLATLLPSIAVGVRRLHDTDRSGWWMLIAIVPLVSLILIVFFAMKGTEGDNRFGASPI